MNKLFGLLTLVAMLAMPVIAASPFQAGEVNVDGFYATATDDFKEFRHGAGVGGTYFISEQIGIGADVVSWEQGSSWLKSVDQVGINVVARQPIGDTGLAPFIGLGAQHSLEEHEWRMTAGAGGELRLGPVGVFAKGDWVNDFTRIGHAEFRAGLRLNF